MVCDGPADLFVCEQPAPLFDVAGERRPPQRLFPVADDGIGPSDVTSAVRRRVDTQLQFALEGRDGFAVAARIIEDVPKCVPLPGRIHIGDEAVGGDPETRERQPLRTSGARSRREYGEQHENRSRSHGNGRGLGHGHGHGLNELFPASPRTAASRTVASLDVSSSVNVASDLPPDLMSARISPRLT